MGREGPPGREGYMAVNALVYSLAKKYIRIIASDWDKIIKIIIK